MKHTPGPWILATCEHYGTYIMAVAQESKVDTGTIQPGICLISPITTLTEEDKANAALICAAPDLLQASRELLIAMEQHQFFMDGYRNGSASIAEVTEAASQEHQAYSKLSNICKPL